MKLFQDKGQKGKGSSQETELGNMHYMTDEGRMKIRDKVRRGS